jgi:hypothetical protein
MACGAAPPGPRDSTRHGPMRQLAETAGGISLVDERRKPGACKCAASARHARPSAGKWQPRTTPAHTQSEQRRAWPENEKEMMLTGARKGRPLLNRARDAQGLGGVAIYPKIG